MESSVDGKLDEAVWGTAAVLTGFSRFSPTDGVPAADSTQVLVWYSPTAIHFGIRAFEAHGSVHATLADRDRITADDQVQILLSTFNDGRQATVFAVNPLGVQSDGALVETGSTSGNGFNNAVVQRETADLSPDFVFQSKGRLTEYGYEVEVQIPFKSIRFQPRREQIWGINIVRLVQHSGSEYTSERQDALRDDSRTGAPILIFDPATTSYTRAAPFGHRSFRGDFLFSYQPNPGTVLFAGYGSTLRDPTELGQARLRRSEDRFFVKLSYLFQM